MIPTEQCDIAIIETPIDDMAGHTEILRFACVAILPKHHPLADLDVLTPETIATGAIVSLYQEHPTTPQLEHAFFASRIPWDPVVQSRYFATSCELVARGGCVSVVDPINAHHYAGDKFVVRRFEPLIVFEIALTLPGEGPHSRLAKEFFARTKAEFQPFLMSANSRNGNGGR